jgi:hypothetical protein
MVTDMKKRKKDIERSGIKRFTIIDLLICAIIIAATVYIGMRFFNLGDFDKEKKIEYSAIFIVPENQRERFNLGDVVLSSDGTTPIGTITNISVSPATKKSFDLTTLTGNIVDEVIIEGYSELKITVSAELLYESDSYYLNGEPLKIDSEIELTTKDFSVYGKCISIVG